METRFIKRTIYFSHIEGEYNGYSVDAFENGICIFHHREHTYSGAMKSFDLACAGKRQIIEWKAVRTSKDNERVVFAGLKYNTINIIELVINQTALQ